MREDSLTYKFIPDTTSLQPDSLNTVPPLLSNELPPQRTLDSLKLSFDSPDYSRNEIVYQVPPSLNLKEEKISESPQSMDFVFILFLVCFVFISQVVSKTGKMISSMLNDLLHVKGRQSIFFGTTENELYNKVLLGVQSAVIISIFCYQYFSHTFGVPIDSIGHTALTITAFFLLLLLFVFIKWLSYNMIGTIFFGKASKNQWIDNYISLISLSGIFLFLPVFLQFYIEDLYYICYYLILLYFFVTGIVIIYKTYILFFHNKGFLFYLFLYLCALEIVPLFLLYKGMIYLFNVVQKNALWL